MTAATDDPSVMAGRTISLALLKPLTENSQAVNASDRPLELSFGEKMAITGKMYVSGNMCNGFSGEGKVSDGELKVKSLAMTRMLCHDAQLNTLDATIGKMLREGAQVDLTENQLTLATADQTLVYNVLDRKSVV